MATIRQIPSGFWQAIIRKKGYPQQSKTFQKKEDCRAWASDVETKMNRGVFSDMSAAESMTIQEGLEKYLEEVTINKKGRDVEEIRINALLRMNFVKKNFATFRQTDAAKLRDDLSKTKSASTVKKELSIISNLFDVANKEWGVTCVNPVSLIAKPKVNNERERRVSELELEYLFDAFNDKAGGSKRKNKMIQNVVIFALETAARQSEILNLEWSDVDIKNRVALLGDTKNGESRGLPLSTKAILSLGVDQSDNVVKLRKGKVFNTTNSAIKQSFRRAVVRARKAYETDFGENVDQNFLIDLHFHDLRHEATTRLAEIFQMHELMKITGHRDSRMLARYYHPKASDLAKKLA